MSKSTTIPPKQQFDPKTTDLLSPKSPSSSVPSVHQNDDARFFGAFCQQQGGFVNAAGRGFSSVVVSLMTVDSAVRRVSVIARHFSMLPPLKKPSANYVIGDSSLFEDSPNNYANLALIPHESSPMQVLFPHCFFISFVAFTALKKTKRPQLTSKNAKKTFRYAIWLRTLAGSGSVGADFLARWMADMDRWRLVSGGALGRIRKIVAHLSSPSYYVDLS